ncbi:MarR family winged helix-turn-helix transcriptional regulator [Egibacter rhizosphaerae]|uniref:MarR family winged helix-turn-helix transcriptional regulator n=1 Tax=Egibacter rhizosphaerae TaxID=1670831 RepID=UPI0013F14981|nr:MarR family transcriptional regulator [Egibacter rhizosphaerae]
MEEELVRYPHDDDALGTDDTAELIILLRSIMAAVDEMLRRYGELQDLQRIEMLAIDLISRRDPDPMTMGELADSLGLSTPALTGRIDRLEQRGWVQRVRSADDRRRIQLRITSHAHDATAQFFRLMIDRLREKVGGHPDADRVAAHRVLETVFAEVLYAQSQIDLATSATQIVDPSLDRAARSDPTDLDRWSVRQAP